MEAEFRHKKVKLLDEEIKLDSTMKQKPLIVHRQEILNAGKANHVINGVFSVKQENNSNLTIKCFILTDLQFIEWAEYYRFAHTPMFSNPAKSTATDPDDFLYSSMGALREGSFNLKIEKENLLFFILDNRFSALTSKRVQLTIWDEWDESVLPIDVVTTTPPQDTSIDETTHKMILSAKKELKILSPYVDMYLVKPLLGQHEKGVKIFMVTRDINEVQDRKQNREALKYFQKALGINHKVNSLIHSRIIIRDELDALVSSADLTQDSLRLNYNTGIILSDPVLVQKLVNYFNQAFKDSKPMSVA